MMKWMKQKNVHNLGCENDDGIIWCSIRWATEERYKPNRERLDIEENDIEIMEKLAVFGLSDVCVFSKQL